MVAILLFAEGMYINGKAFIRRFVLGYPNLANSNLSQDKAIGNVHEEDIYRVPLGAVVGICFVGIGIAYPR